MGSELGTALRRFRRVACLTQEALSQRSGLSVEGISALERGQRQYPRAETIDLLATGLELRDADRTVLVELARRPQPAACTHRAGNPRQLPARTHTFTGRDRELTGLTEVLSRPRDRESPVVVAVVGMGGLGKTTLAIEVASHLVDVYPDGQLYLDLRGHDSRAPLTAHRALAFLIGSLGGDAGDVPDDIDQAAAIFRSLTSDQRLLIVLDNAADAAQVQPLVPAASGCAVLITSRLGLAGLADVHQVPLEVMAPDDSHRLLAALVGDARLSLDAEATAELSEACGGLPLALRIVAARLKSRPTWPLHYLASRLTQARTCLSELCAGDLAVRSNIALSVGHLESSDDPVDQAAERVYLWCGVLPSTLFSTPAVARLVGLTDDEAERALERLADVSLLEAVSPGRYRMHDLVHAVAIERSNLHLTHDERALARDRLAAFYVAVAWRTRHHCRPVPRGVDLAVLVAASGTLLEPNDCLDYLVGDVDQVTGLAVNLAETGQPGTRRLPWLALGLITYFVARVDTAGWPEMLRLALRCQGPAWWVSPDTSADATHPVDAADEALNGALHGHLQEDLALALSGRGEHQPALLEAALATECFRAVSDARSEAASLGTQAIILGRLDRLAEAIDLREQARAFSERLGDDRAVAAGHRDLGLLLARTGELSQGIDHERRSLEIYARIGIPRGVAMAAVNLGAMLREAGDLDHAREHLEKGLRIFHAVGDRAGETEALDELGYFHVVAGDLDLGISMLADGLALTDGSDSGGSEASIHKRLGLALLRLGRASEAEQHWRAALLIHTRRGEWSAVAEARQLLAAPPVLSRS